MQVLLFFFALVAWPVFSLKIKRPVALLPRSRTALPARVRFQVSDLGRSVDFYEKVLGMRLLQRDSSSISGSESALLGFDEKHAGAVELLAMTAGAPLDKGDTYVGIGVTMADAALSVRRSEQFGGKVVRPFDDYGYGASLIPDEDEMVVKTVRYGWVHDPDGYLVEIIEGARAEPLGKVILNVLDLDETVKFYTEKLGMNLHRRRANINSKPKHASICSFVSYDKTEDEGTMLELVYNYATERLNLGKALKHIVLKGNDKQQTKGEIVDPNCIPVEIL